MHDAAITTKDAKTRKHRNHDLQFASACHAKNTRSLQIKSQPILTAFWFDTSDADDFSTLKFIRGVNVK
jgi:hypothetical protein